MTFDEALERLRTQTAAAYDPFALLTALAEEVERLRGELARCFKHEDAVPCGDGNPARYFMAAR